MKLMLIGIYCFLSFLAIRWYGLNGVCASVSIIAAGRGTEWIVKSLP
jgi:hypothetical protein